MCEYKRRRNFVNGSVINEKQFTGGNNDDRTSEITLYYSGGIVNAGHNGDRGSGTGQSNVSTISSGSNSEALYLTAKYLLFIIYSLFSII